LFNGWNWIFAVRHLTLFESYVAYHDCISRCEEFARQGCKVYASSRKTESIAEFGDRTIERISLDVTNDESVQTALKYIIEKEGKIDIVVNNAGFMAPGMPGLLWKEFLI